MPRLRVPTAFHISMLAIASCAPTAVTPDAADDVPDAASSVDVTTNDTVIEDVPTSCDAVPFVSYCVRTQPDSGVNCGPSRVCYQTECTTAGCSFCSFPVECHRNDATTSYCFTTCESSQCTGDCPLVA
jgi:hypothetical protein